MTGSTVGTVRSWHDDEGWGVGDSDATPGGCRVLFAAVHVPSPRALVVGAAVHLEWERADQDGHAFRATRVWPVGQAPVDEVIRVEGPSAAYSSRLEIRFDQDGP
ncbi:cold shock domain-containing protein [Nakamurella deserti]|uniref:cold shock domain-containing protein n=1 Tax=Nakamurella deserti TaxID=2164074 RepID=UPI000DBE6E8E|nr:cold shock domain-containing protein [Nakamurella deserti]